MIAWFIEHATEIAVLCVLIHSVLTARIARDARAHAAGLEHAVDHLAERLGITPDDIREARWREHPRPRPAKRQGGER